MELLLLKTSEYDIFELCQFTFQYGATSTKYGFLITFRTNQFTFQYGATSTKYTNNNHANNYLFTFQYGATSTKCEPMSVIASCNLHSNMELLLPCP